MEYISVKEASLLWNTDVSFIGKMLRSNKIHGATKIGGHWVIPKGTPKPTDGRTKNAKAQVKSDFFHFPLYVNMTDENLIGQLSTEEKSLRQAQLDFFSLDFTKAKPVFDNLSQNAESVYVKLGALFFKGLSSIITDGGKSIKFDLFTINNELNKDFAYKKEMELIIPWLHAFMLEFNAVNKTLHIESDHDYHPSVNGLISFLAFFLNDDIMSESPVNFNPIAYEMLCRNIEINGYYYEAQELHMLLFITYSLSSNKRLYEYHLRKAFDIAINYNLILSPACYEYYYQDIFKKVLSDYPADFAKNIHKHSKSINNSLNKYKKSRNKFDLHTSIPPLSGKETSFAMYAVGGYSNKKVAEIMHLSERTVSHRYSEIYEKTGVKGKNELVKLMKEEIL